MRHRRETKLSDRQRRVLLAARKARWLLVALLIVAGVMVADRLGLFGRRPPSHYDDERYHAKTFRVVRVIDGDTLDVEPPDARRKHTRVRLWGVDTPETKHPRMGVQHFGAEAHQFTRDACTGRDVALKLLPRQTRDKYGRLLAYVILPDGRMLNRELVRLGYGYADPRFEHPHGREFAGLQEEAMKRRLGLWRDVAAEDLPYYYQGRLKLPAR